MASAPKPIRAVAFDFDGVLRGMWTHPADIFPQADALVRAIHARGGVPMAVVSFNNCAGVELAKAGLAHLFDAVRAKSNAAWDHLNKDAYEHTLAANLSKVEQIRNVCANEWACHGIQPEEVLLIDDELDNIRTAEASGIPCLFVEDMFGGVDAAKVFSMLFPADPVPPALQRSADEQDDHKAQIGARYFKQLLRHDHGCAVKKRTQVNRLLFQVGMEVFHTHFPVKNRPDEDSPLHAIVCALEHDAKQLSRLLGRVEKAISVFHAHDAASVRERLPDELRAVWDARVALHATDADGLP